MGVEGCGDAHAIVLEDRTALRHFVRPDERRQRGPALVFHSQLDVEFVGVEERPRHRGERRRTVGVDRRGEPGRPAEEEQRAIAGVVVGMLMSEEDGAELSYRQPGESQLPRGYLAAV